MVTFPPTIPFTRQDTAILAVFWTVAVNCLVLLIRTVILVGEIVMLTGCGSGIIVTEADPAASGTSWLVACTVTVAGDGTTAGAVYRPVASIRPTTAVPPTVPFTSHVTVWSAVFWTVAANCAVVFTVTPAAAGVTVTYVTPCRAWPECGSIISGATSTVLSQNYFFESLGVSKPLNFWDRLKTDPEACWQVDTFSGHLTGVQSPQNNMI